MINLEEIKIKVYAKLDSNKTITEVTSGIFLQNTAGYKLIDEGLGDKYAHAQSQYLEKTLMDLKGRFNYKFKNKLIELTEKEKVILFPEGVQTPSTEERLQTAEEALLFLLGGGEI